jgi:hypothetical protein
MNRDAAEEAFREFNRVTEFLYDRFRYAACFTRNFDTNPVSGQQQYFQMHLDGLRQV